MKLGRFIKMNVNFAWFWQENAQLKVQVEELSSKLDDHAEKDNEAEHMEDHENQVEVLQQKLDSLESELGEAHQLVENLQEQLQQSAESAEAARVETVDATTKQARADMEKCISQLKGQVQQQLDHWTEAVVAKFERKIKDCEDYHGHQVHACLR